MKKYKERLSEAFRLYFVLVTLISGLLLVLGLLFDRERTFGYEAFLSPHVYAGIGVLPVLLFHSEREMSLKRVILQRILQVLFIEAAILLLVFRAPNIPSDRKEIVTGIAIGILVIYGLSIIIEYLFALPQARKINQDLEAYQRGR